jgi:hypothetical protein
MSAIPKVAPNPNRSDDINDGLCFRASASDQHAARGSAQALCTLEQFGILADRD